MSTVESANSPGAADRSGEIEHGRRARRHLRRAASFRRGHAKWQASGRPHPLLICLGAQPGVSKSPTWERDHARHRSDGPCGSATRLPDGTSVQDQLGRGPRRHSRSTAVGPAWLRSRRGRDDRKTRSDRQLRPRPSASQRGAARRAAAPSSVAVAAFPRVAPRPESGRVLGQRAIQRGDGRASAARPDRSRADRTPARSKPRSAGPINTRHHGLGVAACLAIPTRLRTVEEDAEAHARWSRRAR